MKFIRLFICDFHEKKFDDRQSSNSKMCFFVTWKFLIWTLDRKSVATMIAINLFECNFTTTIATCFPLFDAYQWMMYNLSVVMNPEKRAPSGEWIRQFFLKCGALHRKSHIFISHTNFDSVCVCALISFHCWLIHPYSFFFVLSDRLCIICGTLAWFFFFQNVEKPFRRIFFWICYKKENGCITPKAFLSLFWIEAKKCIATML